MNDNNFDVTIIGGGPAGATAAIMLGQAGKQVALVDQQPHPRVGGGVGWTGTKIATIIDSLGLPVQDILACPFQDLTFYSADFSKKATPNLTEPVGYFVHRSALENALLTAAERHDVKLNAGEAVADMRLMEHYVEVLLASGKKIRSQLVVLATGRSASLLDRVGLSTAAPLQPMWTAQVEVPVSAKEGSPVPRVAVALGLNSAGSFAICGVLADRVTVTINWFGDRNEARPSLITLCKSAASAGVLPRDISAEAAKSAVARSPAAQALDLDTHVGKHALVIGDAGGFVSAASNEGIYPAMWSAQLAVEVLVQAIENGQSQDELMKFDTVWRIQMADYLRAPNTDVQFLLPLIFSNQPMADRMASAFFAGENI